MTVIIDSISQAISGVSGSGTSQSFSITVGLITNSALVVKTTGFCGSNLNPISSVTCDGTPMSLVVGAIPYNYGPGENYVSQIYGLVGVAAGTHTIQVNFSTALTYWSAWAESFGGANQTGGSATFYGAATTNGATGTAAIGPLTSATTDAAIDVVCAVGQTISVPVQTEDFPPLAVGAAGSYEVGSASPSFGWTISGSHWAESACCIAAVGSGAGGGEPGGGTSGTRTVLAGSLTLQCNGSTGNDMTGNGTAAKPFATPLGAYIYARNNLDLAGNIITAQLTGNYVGATWVFSGRLTGATGPQSFVIQGTVGSPGAVTIIGTPGTEAIQSASDAAFTLSNLSITPGSGGFGVVANNGTVAINNVDFTTGGAVAVLDAAAPRSLIIVGSFIQLSNSGGSCTNVITCEDHGQINLTGSWTMNGFPSWSGAFVQSDLGGMIDGTGFSFSGSAVGSRFNAISNGIVFTGTGGGSPTFYPGSTVGNVGSGGIYC